MDKFTKARDLLQEEGIDGWLISCNEDGDIHSPYFLGVKSHARHFIYLDKDGNHEILAAQMEAPMIQKSLRNQDILAKVSPYMKHKDMITWLKRLVSKPKVALNFGPDSLRKATGFADYIKAGEVESLRKISPRTNFVSALELIRAMREVKSMGEINNLRENIKITIEVLEDVPNWVKVGMSEKEVQAKIHYEYLKLGEPSFDTIVAAGENSADPHHNSSVKKITSGALLIDTGIRKNQMSSDITWTYWIGGEPPEDFTKAYKVLFDSKKIANAYMKVGIETRTPGIKCREYLAAEGYNHEELFIHGLGHALGYEVHDIGNRMSWKAPKGKKFLENAIYTNEPGLYWQGVYGLRLEDDILVKKDGCEQLSHNPKDPIAI